jgi:AP-5 complex subunit beta-1
MFDSTRGAISVKHINKSHEHVLTRLTNKFKPYLIDPNASLSELAVPTQVLGLIFLPPKYHLLLRFNIKPNHTLIELTTDYWFNLTFVDQYLDDLFAN